jgi:hypothetical protein
MFTRTRGCLGDSSVGSDARARTPCTRQLPLPFAACGATASLADSREPHPLVHCAFPTGFAVTASSLCDRSLDASLRSSLAQPPPADRGHDHRLLPPKSATSAGGASECFHHRRMRADGNVLKAEVERKCARTTAACGFATSGSRRLAIPSHPNRPRASLERGCIVNKRPGAECRYGSRPHQSVRRQSASTAATYECPVQWPNSGESASDR